MEFYGIIVPFLIAFPSFPRAAPSFRLGPAPSVWRAMPLTAQQLFEVEDQLGTAEAKSCPGDPLKH